MVNRKSASVSGNGKGQVIYPITDTEQDKNIKIIHIG